MGEIFDPNTGTQAAGWEEGGGQDREGTRGVGRGVWRRGVDGVDPPGDAAVTDGRKEMAGADRAEAREASERIFIPVLKRDKKRECSLVTNPAAPCAVGCVP